MSDLAALLATRRIQTAVIIDDAFDELPRATDLGDDTWSLFFDDMTGAEEKIFEERYGPFKDADRDELRVSNDFVAFLWKERERLPKRVLELFGDYGRDNAQERKNLGELVERLKALGLACATMGRDLDLEKAKAADLVFVDLFLGFAQLDMDVASTIDRVKALVADREATPPLIVLMSNSTRLQEKRNDFRDDAGLLGSTFRVMSKPDLRKEGGLERTVLRLADGYEDAKKIAHFIEAWTSGLELAKTRFIRHIRRLDLTDLSQIRALLLQDEGEPLGSYLLDVCDAALEYEVESDTGTIQAAQALNEIDIDRYVPPHLLGSTDLQELVFRMVFHHPERAKLTHDGMPAGVQFGDLLRWRTATGEFTDEVSLVITPACDLARASGALVHLLGGALQRLTPRHWTYVASPPRTPIVILSDGSRRWVKWDLKNVRTFTAAEILTQMNAPNGPQRIARLREMYSVELQQKFVADFGRVGQVANPPATFPVRTVVLFVSADATLRALNIDGLDSANCYVGRDKDAKPVHHLILSEQACDSMQERVAALNEADVHLGARESLAALKEDQQFFASARMVMSDNIGTKQTKNGDGVVYATVVRNQAAVVAGATAVGDQRRGLLVVAVTDEAEEQPAVAAPAA